MAIEIGDEVTMRFGGRYHDGEVVAYDPRDGLWLIRFRPRRGRAALRSMWKRVVDETDDHAEKDGGDDG